MTGMSSYQNSFSSYRGRGNSSRGGRGRTDYSNRGGRGSYSDLNIQVGGKKLIAKKLTNIEDDSVDNTLQKLLGEDIPQDHPLFKEYMDYIHKKKEKESIPSYANISKDESSDSQYFETDFKEIILLIEEHDIQWKSNPDMLLGRYLNKTHCIHGALKQRQFYEGLLISTNTVEINHFSASNKSEVYNFSKFVIKKIISCEEWGISPLAEKEWFSPLHKFNFKFNYWDYIQSFTSVLLYENESKKHSWFLKICENCFRSPIPNWFFSWWKKFGATKDILPDNIQELLKQWASFSPMVYKCKLQFIIDGQTTCWFFMEFGIPWIWKWKPVFSYTEEMIPCLKRQGMIKYWDKLSRIDPATKKPHGDEMVAKIMKKVQDYKDQKQEEDDEVIELEATSLSPFQKLLQKYEGTHSREEIIDIYIEEMKKDLEKHTDYSDSRSNMSTSSRSIDQDAQDPSEEDIIFSLDDALETLKDSIKGKGKAKR